MPRSSSGRFCAPGPSSIAVFVNRKYPTPTWTPRPSSSVRSASPSASTPAFVAPYTPSSGRWLTAAPEAIGSMYPRRAITYGAVSRSVSSTPPRLTSSISCCFARSPLRIGSRIPRPAVATATSMPPERRAVVAAARRRAGGAGGAAAEGRSVGDVVGERERSVAERRRGLLHSVNGQVDQRDVVTLRDELAGGLLA